MYNGSTFFVRSPPPRCSLLPSPLPGPHQRGRVSWNDLLSFIRVTEVTFTLKTAANAPPSPKLLRSNEAHSTEVSRRCCLYCGSS